MKFRLLKRLLKAYGLDFIYKDEGGNHYFLRVDYTKQMTVYSISSQSFDVTQFNINDDIIALLMGHDEEVDIIDELPNTTLPRVYMEDQWHLIKSDEGFMKIYILYKNENGVKRFTRIAYVKDTIYGVSQMTFSDNLADALIKGLENKFKIKRSAE